VLMCHNTELMSEIPSENISLMSLCVSGSDKAIVVVEKHAVSSNSMKPPFPAGTELAMFGQPSLLRG